MNPTPDPSTAPENILADKILFRIPRVGHITKADLNARVDWNDGKVENLYDKYFDLALNILEEEGYIQAIDSSGFHDAYDIKLSLTIPGRVVQDTGGYVKALKERKAKEAFEEKVSKAEGIKKLHDNKVKYLVLILAIVASIGCFWLKYSDSGKFKSETQNQSKGDTTAKLPQSQTKADSFVPPPQKRHLVKASSQPPKNSTSQADIPQIKKKEEPYSPEPVPKPREASSVGSSNGLHEYYGLDINPNGKVPYIVGSPAILRYFKLSGSKHKGMFVITTSGLFFTLSDPLVYEQSYNFSKIMAVYSRGWTNEHNPCPGVQFFKLSGRLNVYPCDDIIRYKIGNGNEEQAVEYYFKKPS